MKLIKSDRSLGGEIVGLDIGNKLTKDEINFINNSWNERLVLVFKNQNLDDPKLINFSKYFGELDPPGPNPYGITFLPEFPEINVISNVRNDKGTPIGNLGDGEAVWHADMTYLETPPKAGILYALEVPENQGNTHFANMALAYSELPEKLKQKIDGRILIFIFLFKDVIEYFITPIFSLSKQINFLETILIFSFSGVSNLTFLSHQPSIMFNSRL